MGLWKLKVHHFLRQVAYRHFLQRTATFSKAELPRPPMAPLSPERRHGAACLVKSVLRSYLAKARCKQVSN